MRAIFPIMATFVLIVISLVLVIGISLGIGWVLTLFLPFSLFEGALLGIIAVIATWTVWISILRSKPTFEFEEEEDDYELDEIPESRFWTRSLDRTWENWFRYILANWVYVALADSRRYEKLMNERQVQEMSICLADSTIGALKVRSPHAKRLQVSKRMLKQEMVKMGQRPFDDEVLNIAVDAVNVKLVHLEEEMREVMRKRLWDEPAELF